MKTYLQEFVEKNDYPENCVEEILRAYDHLKDNDNFKQMLSSFYTDNDLSAQYISDILENVGRQCSVNFYTVQLVFLLCLSRELKKQYVKAGIDDEIYCDTVNDILYKLKECYELKKVWGIISFDWFNRIFRMEIFAFGRLEYTLGKMSENTIVAGKRINAGDDVIYIHIPSSGKPFDRRARLDSYDKAYRFYKKNFGDNEPVFCCSSWLLFPQNRNILGNDSNVVSFMDDFKIISGSEYPDNRNMWRIFGAEADRPAEELPRKTSMQRAFAAWIQNGHNLGGGVGVFLYDPIKKTTII